MPSHPQALWYTRCSVPTPLSLAAQFGWIDQEFAPDGIEIKSLRESNDPVEQASHYDHTLPHSFRQGGSIPPIWARANGQQTRVIGLSWTDEYQAIIALPGSGIRTVKDLRGRRIGLPLHDTRIDHNRASALRAFAVALQFEGLKLDDVQAVDLADADYAVAQQPGSKRAKRATYANEAYALARGTVDAVYVKDVRGLELAALLGAQVVLDIGTHADPFIRISNCAPRPLTVNADTIEQHPELVARFLARVQAAAEWARKNPDETVRWIAAETGWSERLVRRSFGPEVHLNLGIDLAEDKVRGIETLRAFLAESKFIPDSYTAAQWIDARPLQALEADASLRRAA